MYLCSIGHSFQQGDVAPPGALWPKPTGAWEENENVRTINPATLSITADITGCDVIDRAIERYKALIVLDPSAIPDPDKSLTGSLTISVTDKNCAPDYYPYYGMNETYQLQVNENDIKLSAHTIWGVLRGLESFSQLIYLTDDKKYQINDTAIVDGPRFAYRGMMIDTARHFMPMSILINILDSMSWDKFNAFHWHVVDDQSFPYPSRMFPELQEKGAYSPHHVYTRDDVNTILGEARLRGIFVVSEFDTPGHTWSWGQSHPELITPCWGEGLSGGPEVPDYPNHGPREVMNPMEETTYQFLDKLYDEIIEDFPDRFVHLGMDEAYYACWQSNPNISVWMKEMNFTEYFEVEQYYSRRLIDIVASKGSDYIIWQDPLEKGVSVNPSTLVEVWKDDPTWQYNLESVVSRGYNAILSSPWYLNYISYGEDWKNYYNTEPHNFTADSSQWGRVKGGEVCMWVEYVDGTNILSRLWPRASAVAERLWSNKQETDVESAKFRLDQQRCRYVRRGIPAQPILNGYCGDYEWTGVDDPQPVPQRGTVGAASASLVFVLSAISVVVNRSH